MNSEPNPARGWMRSLFTLAGRLRGIDSSAAADDWQSVVDEWYWAYRAEIPASLTKCRAQFAQSWARVRRPYRDTGVLAHAREMARKCRSNEDRLLTVFQILTAECGPVFHLSVRAAMDCIGSSKRTAAKLLKEFRDDGILLLVERGTPHPVRRKASRFMLMCPSP